MPPEPFPEELRAALALTRALPEDGQRELERALSGKLAPRLTAADRRLAELGHLAALLDARARFAGAPRGPGRHSWPGVPPVDPRHAAVPRVTAALYDRDRPPGSPPAATLTERYGSWRAACRAAYGLRPDGTYLGFGQPQPAPFRGRGSRPAAYTEAEAIAGIRACARALGRRPTSTSYRAWVTERALQARRAGRPRPRLADYNTLRALFGGWPQALAEAAIPDTAAAPRPRAGSPGRSAVVAGDRHGALPIHEAARLAHAAGGSLDWLAGRVERRGRAASTTAVRLDADAIRAARRDRGIPEARLRAALGVGLGAWRALLSGRSVPSLGAVAALAGLLDCPCDALLIAV